MYRNKGDREKIERALGYRFRNERHLLQALTRRSALNEGRQRADIGDFQRLEFIGDKVLNLVVSDILLENHPRWSEGRLTTEVSRFVHNKGPLAQMATNIELGKYLIMGAGEDRMLGVRENVKALSDAFEAIIGALWLDSDKNFAFLREFLLMQYKALGLTDFNKDYEETVMGMTVAKISNGLFDSLGLHELASGYGCFFDEGACLTPLQLKSFLATKQRATKPLTGISAHFERSLLGLAPDRSESDATTSRRTEFSTDAFAFYNDCEDDELSVDITASAGSDEASRDSAIDSPASFGACSASFFSDKKSKNHTRTQDSIFPVIIRRKYRIALRK